MSENAPRYIFGVPSFHIVYELSLCRLLWLTKQLAPSLLWKLRNRTSARSMRLLIVRWHRCEGPWQNRLVFVLDYANRLASGFEKRAFTSTGNSWDIDICGTVRNPKLTLLLPTAPPWSLLDPAIYRSASVTMAITVPMRASTETKHDPDS